MGDEYVWDRKLACGRGMVDLLNPGQTPRDLAINRTLAQAVEAWVEGNFDGAIRLVGLAEKYCRVHKSTFE